MRKFISSERRKSVWALSLFLVFLSRFAYGDFQQSIFYWLSCEDSKRVLTTLKNDPDLERYRDPTQAEFFGKILRWAAGQSDRELVEFLLAKKVDPNLPHSITGTTALHMAASPGGLMFSGEDTFKKLTEVIELLLAYGANPNTVDEKLTTPLHAATLNGNLTGVEALLKGGADPHRLDIKGDTPLHVAAENGHEDLVKLFLAQGLVLFRNEEGLNPLHLAARYGKTKAIKVLLEEGKVDLNETTSQGQTALHLAAEKGRSDTVSFLLQSNAHPNLTDIRGQTPLHLAAKFDQEKIVELLLAQNVDLIKDLDGRTPFHLAAIVSKRWSMMKLFLEKGVDREETDSLGNTPFLLAVAKGHKPWVSLFLDKDVNVNRNAINHDGKGALRLALSNKDRTVVWYLLWEGLNPNERDKEGFNLLHYATAYGRQDLVEYLLDQGVDPN